MQMKWTAVALAATLVCLRQRRSRTCCHCPAAPVAAAPAARIRSSSRSATSAPISGAQAHYGKDNENGVRMAIEDLNAQGVMIGGKKVKFEIVAEDDAADPKQGTAAAQKLCDAKVAGVVGHLNSGTTIPASKVYNDCGIPHVTGAATNPNLTKPGYKTTYRIIANDIALGAGLALLRRRHAEAQEGRHHRRPYRLRPGRCRSVQEDRQGQRHDRWWTSSSPPTRPPTSWPS